MDRNGKNVEKASARAPKAKPYDEDDLDEFIDGYVNGWLFFETLPPPDKGERWTEGDSYFDGGDFTVAHLTLQSRRNIRAHCRRLLDRIAHLIPGNREWYEGTEFSHAGHDAALTAQELSEGFARSEWNPSVRDAMVRACDDIGGLFVEPARGRIHIR